MTTAPAPDPDEEIPVQLIWPGAVLDVATCEVTMTRLRLGELLLEFKAQATDEHSHG